MSGNNIVVDQPKPLNQNRLGYLTDTGWYACWVAAAEMVKTTYAPGARIKRPDFAPPSTQNSEAGMDQRISFFLKQEKHLQDLAFRPLNRVGKAWDPEALSNALREWGPLFAYGLFFLDESNLVFSPVPPTPANRVNGVQHAICVYGVRESMGRVFYIDPWDGQYNSIATADFAQRVHPTNALAVAGCEDNRQIRLKRKS